MILGALGGAVGTMAAAWLLKLVARTESGTLSRFQGLELGWQSIGVALGLTALLTVASILGPAVLGAWSCRRSRLDPSIGRTAGVGPAHRRALGLCVVAQVALALLLLIGAGLLVHSMIRLQAVDPGFDPSGLVAMDLELPTLEEAQSEERSLVLDLILEQVRSLPGVSEAILVSPLPLSGQNVVLSFEIEGAPKPPPDQRPSAHWRSVSPGFFHTMRIPLIEGRTFTTVAYLS